VRGAANACLVITLMAFLATEAVAQEIQSIDGYRVKAFIQPSQDITEQQTVQLVIEAEGEGNPKLEVSGLDNLTNLRLIGGPSHNFSSLWSGGRMTAKTKLVYTVVPEGPGPAGIPALTVSLEGRRVTTPPIRFTVQKAPAGVPPKPDPRRSRGKPAGDTVDVFVQSRLGAEEVWVGQAVSLSVLLFRGKEDIRGPSFIEQPSLSSFWVEDLEVDANAESSQVRVQGRPYIVYPMARKILVPQTAGEIEIEPFVMQMQVLLRTSDPFESLFGRRQNIVRKSQPLQLNVRPLPEAGRPDDFGGAVGTFTFDVSIDREEAAVNEAVALTATVEGEGFLRAVDPPSLDLPPDIKMFSPKVTPSSRAEGGKLVSRKVWEWILVPLVPGELKIPDIRFTYFDTARGDYVVAGKTPPVLVVRQSGERPEGAVARGDIQLQRKDLAFIKPLRGTLSQSAPRVHRDPLFVTALLLPLVWAPAVILVGRHRAKLQRNRGLARARRARSRARQRLRAVAKRMESSDSAQFHEEVARALVEYVADRFDRSAAGLTYELADELLASRGLDEELRRRFRACLETCDFARYVPAASAQERRTEVLSEAGAIVEQLEKAR
jgi:hypothetical protein